MRTLNALVLAVLTAGSIAMVTAGPAAANEDGTCDVSSITLNPNADFCLYYSPSLGGAVYDRSFASGNDGDLGDNHFIGAVSGGGGQVVRNNAASARDGVKGESVYVYYSPNFVGTSVFVPSSSWVNLGVLRNNEASYRWTE